MKGRVLTRVGGVLILETHRTFTIYVVGRVFEEWQKDFHDGQEGLRYDAMESRRADGREGHRCARGPHFPARPRHP